MKGPLPDPAERAKKGNEAQRWPDMTTRPAIPESGKAITADWMQRALSSGGAVDSPQIESVVVENIGTESGALGELLRCTLTYVGAAAQVPGSVVVKLSSSDRKSLRIARALSLYKREHACFRQLAPHMRIGLPDLFYGDFDDASHRFVLVLEDLHGMESVDQVAGADVERTRRAVRGAAELHGQFWDRLDRPPLSHFLASVGQQRPWLSQLIYLICLAPCLERFGSLFPDRMRNLAEAFGPRVADHMRNLATGPQTLTHGDFRLDNMFFTATGRKDFTVIDWQTSGLIGDGLYDLAYFMTTSVSTEVRRGIEREALMEYCDVLRGAGVKHFTFEQCWYNYRRNIFGMLVPSVCAGGGIDMGNERIRAKVETLLCRTLAAIEDLDAAEFMPAGGGLMTAANAFSLLSSCAYRAYSFAYRRYRPQARLGSN